MIIILPEWMICFFRTLTIQISYFYRCFFCHWNFAYATWIFFSIYTTKFLINGLKNALKWRLIHFSLLLISLSLLKIFLNLWFILYCIFFPKMVYFHNWQLRLSKIKKKTWKKIKILFRIFFSRISSSISLKNEGGPFFSCRSFEK